MMSTTLNRTTGSGYPGRGSEVDRMSTGETNVQQEDRWQAMVRGARILDGVRNVPAIPRLLETVLAVFPEVAPTDDYAGYAVRQMCLAILQAVQSQGPRPSGTVRPRRRPYTSNKVGH